MGGQSFCSHVGQPYHIAAEEPAGESTPTVCSCRGMQGETRDSKV